MELITLQRNTPNEHPPTPNRWRSGSQAYRQVVGPWINQIYIIGAEVPKFLKNLVFKRGFNNWEGGDTHSLLINTFTIKNLTFFEECHPLLPVTLM